MSDGACFIHGGTTHTKSSAMLADGEFITRIEGTSNTACIISLTFVTNKRM